MPSRKAISVGIDMIPAAPASAVSTSVSTLAKTMSSCWAAAASKIGPNRRHGPHHDAHQSISTMSLPVIVEWKASSDKVIVPTFAPDARSPPA